MNVINDERKWHSPWCRTFGPLWEKESDGRKWWRKRASAMQILRGWGRLWSAMVGLLCNKLRAADAHFNEKQCNLLGLLTRKNARFLVVEIQRGSGKSTWTFLTWKWIWDFLWVLVSWKGNMPILMRSCTYCSLDLNASFLVVEIQLGSRVFRVTAYWKRNMYSL